MSSDEQQPPNPAEEGKIQDDTTPLTSQEVFNPDRLTLFQIEEAKIKIMKLHPLANTPMDKVFPVFGCCFKIMFSCCINSRRERMAKLKKLMIEEEEAAQKKISDTLTQNNVRFDGAGPMAQLSGQSVNS